MGDMKFLQRDIQSLLVELNSAIEQVKDEARRLNIDPPTKMRNMDGTFALTPLLSAKAQLLSSLFELNKDK